MTKAKKQPLPKTNSWWHNLPHKWFLIFQLLLPIIASIILFFIFALATNMMLTDVDIPFFLPIILLSCLLGLCLTQFCLIKHYYGWKIFFCSLVLFPAAIIALFFTIPLVNPLIRSIFTHFSSCVPCGSCEPPTACFGSHFGFIIIFFAHYAPLIPQYWRSNTHGRK